MRLRPRTWWLVFAGLLIAGVALSVWLWATHQVWAALAVNGSFDAAAAVWLGLGLWRWREHPAVRRIGLVVAGTAAAAILVNIFGAFSMRLWVISVMGVWAMSVGFFVALQLARWALGRGHPMFGVARALLDEAVNMKAAVALLVMLFVAVPFIPLMLGRETRLSYQLQSFLTYSTMGVTVLLSVLTIVIAVTSITRELDDRQIFMTMSKPVGRGQYLLGKWLGLAVLNLLLVGVSGVGIYTYARLVAERPAMNEQDVVEAYEQVLVARRVTKPVSTDPAALQAQYEARLEQLRQQDPATYGQPGAPAATVSPAIRAAVQRQVVVDWYAIRPQDTHSYVFNGLLPAKQLAQTVQLRIKPQAAGATPDDMIYLSLRFNEYDDAVLSRKLADGRFHVIDVPVSLINDEGSLKVEIYNPPRPDGRPAPTINFNTADGLSLLYKVSTFEANLAAAMLLLWLRLCFLGMLALAAGTFLGFHVAALLATLVCVAASSTGFLHESIDSYAMFPATPTTLWDTLLLYPRSVSAHVGKGEYWKAFQVFVSMCGAGFLKLVPDLTKYSGTNALAYGLVLPWDHLGKAFLQLGVLWTGATGVVAWLIFRGRELARVQV